MKFLEDITRNEKKFQRIVGLKIEELKILSNKLEEKWKKSEIDRKNQSTRKRKIGAGNSYKHKNLETKILIVLLYYKLYITQEFLGMLVDLDQANISRLLKKMLPLIELVADPELATYLEKAKEEMSDQRTQNIEELLKIHPHLRDISTDATEQPCYRSKNDETQKKYYSGKKKDHTLKTQISVSYLGRILSISKTHPGSTHDKKIMDIEKTIDKYPIATCQRMDSAYQGVKKEFPEHYIDIPTKKPKGKELSHLAKEHNKAGSKRRVIVEHIFSRFKKFKIFASLYRGKIEDYNQIFRNVAALLNFKLMSRHVII